MRNLIDIITLLEDATNDNWANRADRPMDRRETSQLAFQQAAEKRAEEEGITVLQARDLLRSEQHIKRNAHEIRAKRWAEKAANLEEEEESDAVSSFRKQILDGFVEVFSSYPKEQRPKVYSMLRELSQTKENRAIIDEAFDLTKDAD